MKINIVFDGPPSANGPRFVEVETETGRSFRLGEWVELSNGYWAIQFDPVEIITPEDTQFGVGA